METSSTDEGDMLDRGSGAMPMSRLLQAFLGAALLLAVGPLASASAAGPVLTISSPQTGGSSNESAPLIAGVTSDDADIVTVRLYKGDVATGTPAQTLESAVLSGGVWGVVAASLADGTYTVVAQQLDSETLETGSSEEVTFTVDTAPPDVSLNPVATPTNDSTPKFGGAVGAGLGDEHAVTVSVYAGAAASGTPVQTGQASITGGSWSFTATSLPDGEYTVVASQRDAAGNVGTGGPATFAIDVTAPVVSLNTAAVAPLTNDATPAFSGGAGEAPGDGATVLVVVHKGSTLGGAVAIEQSAPVTGGAWSFTSPHLADGTYTVQVLQRDQAGNEGHSASATFRVDTTPPTLVVTSPKSHEELKSSSRPTFGGTTSNGSGEPTAVTIEIFSGESTAEGSLVQTLSVESSGSSWTTASGGPRLSNGVYTVRVRELDSAGNLGESTAVTFKVQTPSPIVTLDSLPHWTDDPTPSFAGTADTFEAAPEVTLKIWRGTSASGVVADTLVAPESAGAWAAVASSVLPDGTYTAQAEQFSEAKNPPGVSNTTTFTVDTQAPAPTLTAPRTSTGLEAVSGVAGAAPGDRQQVTVELFAGAGVEPGDAVETVTVNRVGAAWSATLAGLGAGEYTVLARQSDEAGNVGASEPSRFTVTAPLAPAPPSSSTPGLTSTATQPIAVTPSPTRLMQPFPIVRIAGAETSSGARIRLLTVLAPAGAKAEVACTGHGCGLKPESRVAASSSNAKGSSGTVTLTFKRFERSLRAGVTLQIRVTKAGEIGKFTSFAIRRGKLPVRTDSCLAPTSSRPSACPSS